MWVAFSHLGPLEIADLVKRIQGPKMRICARGSCRKKLKLIPPDVLLVSLHQIDILAVHLNVTASSTRETSRTRLQHGRLLRKLPSSDADSERGRRNDSEWYVMKEFTTR